MTSRIIPSPYPRGHHPEVSLPGFVFADAARRADKPALIDGPSGRAITYGELVGSARLAARGLAAREEHITTKNTNLDKSARVGLFCTAAASPPGEALPTGSRAGP